MKTAVLTAAALVFAGTGLASCSGGGSVPSDAPSEAAAGINVADGRLVLPAVKGNPGAVYFDITNNGDKDTAVVSVFVDGAKMAMMHMTSEAGGMAPMKEMDQLALAKGATIKFAPGGNHIMAMDLDPALERGDTTDVTLALADGNKITFPANVLAPGDAR